MWVTKLLISQVKKRIFCPKTTKFGPKLAFWSIWARPCRLFRCPVGGSVGGCGARAVSRKTPIYFIYIIHRRYLAQVLQTSFLSFLCPINKNISLKDDIFECSDIYGLRITFCCSKYSVYGRVQKIGVILGHLVHCYFEICNFFKNKKQHLRSPQPCFTLS